MKNRISDSNDLAQRIKELELLQARQTEEIRASFREMAEQLRPSNLLKGAFNSVISSPGLRATALETAISSGAGILGKKLVVRDSGNIVRKVVGTAVQFLLSNYVRNKIPDVKEAVASGKNGVEH